MIAFYQILYRRRNFMKEVLLKLDRPSTLN